MAKSPPPYPAEFRLEAVRLLRSGGRGAVQLADTRRNDCQGLDAAILDAPEQLAALRDQTLVIDLGYYSHSRLARLLAAGVHLISRLLTQASVQVTAERPVQPPLPELGAGRITVLRDQEVILGSPTNRAGAVLPGLRLVTALVEPLPAAVRRGRSRSSTAC